MNFDMSGRYMQLVQYGRESAYKCRVAWAVFSLGVCMRERQQIYEDLNESSSASPGGSQQLEIPPSLNSKRAASFFQFRWFFTRRRDFNAHQDSIVHLFFCRAPTFYKSACFFVRLQYFPNPPDFCKSANIFQICLIFWKAPVFSKSAWFSEKRQYFSNPPDFLKTPIFLKSAWFFEKRKEFMNWLDFLLLQIFVYIFSIYFLHSYY
jgi:hypothetical protein